MSLNLNFKVACSDGQVVERAQAWAHLLNSLFFRFTPQLDVEIPLDTKDNAILINLIWKTKVKNIFNLF